MAGYITGVTIGSIILTIIFAFVGHNLWLRRNHFKKIKVIGQNAETKINNDIRTWARQTKNKFINSSIYKYQNNKVFEVDSILVTSKALYVIEIKSIKGVVQGFADHPSWTKVLGDKQFKTTNAIIQNERHIDHISKMIHAKVPTISLIIYSNRTNYLDVKNIPDHVALIKHAELFDTLDKVEKSLAVKLSIYDIETITKTIKSFRTNKKVDINLHKKITRSSL